MEQLNFDFVRTTEEAPKTEQQPLNSQIDELNKLNSLINVMIIQNQLVNLSLRMNAIENLLTSKNLITQDEYVSEIKKLTEQTAVEIQKLHDEQKNGKEQDKNVPENILALKDKLNKLKPQVKE